MLVVVLLLRNSNAPATTLHLRKKFQSINIGLHAWKVGKVVETFKANTFVSNFVES